MAFTSGTRSYEIGTAYRVNGDEILADSSLSKVERANNLDVGMRGDTSLVSYQVNLFYKRNRKLCLFTEPWL